MSNNNGWICPKCGAVMAPWVATCTNCKGNHSTMPYMAANQPSTPYAPTLQYKVGDILCEMGTVNGAKNEVKTTTVAESPLWVPGAIYRNENLKNDEKSYLQESDDDYPAYGLGV